MSDDIEKFLSWARSCRIAMKTKREKKIGLAIWRVTYGQIVRLRQEVLDLKAEIDRLEDSNCELARVAREVQEELEDLSKIMR